MEEDFFILEGKVAVVVDGRVNTLSAGDLSHIEPGEVHYDNNPNDGKVKMVSTLAPYQGRQGDRGESGLLRPDGAA